MSRNYGRRLVSITINSRRLSDGGGYGASITAMYDGAYVGALSPMWDDYSQTIYVNQNNVLSPSSSLYLQVQGYVEVNYIDIQTVY
jgi:hypothetical protein